MRLEVPGGHRIVGVERINRARSDGAVGTPADRATDCADKVLGGTALAHIA